MMKDRTIQRAALAISAAATMLATSAHAADACEQVKGTWKQSHISMKLDTDLMADATASWTFGEDGKVKYDSGFGVMSFAYECRDDVILFHSLIPSRLKIVRAGGDKMVWGPDVGFIYVTR